MKQINFFINVFFILIWLMAMTGSDAYFIPYLVCGTAGILCCCALNKEKPAVEGKGKWALIVILAGIFSCAAALANYKLFVDIDCPNGTVSAFLYKIAYPAAILAGGFCTAEKILEFTLKRISNLTWEAHEYGRKPLWIFIAAGTGIAVFDLLFLFMAKYPGQLTTDSYIQLMQIMSGSYSNHHPFYHTMIIKLFFQPGMLLFGEINAAVALYSAFQVVFMSMCLAYGAVTLYEMKLSSKVILLYICFCAFMPYNIMYSFTMWKDILFGGATLLFVIAVFRRLYQIGNCSWTNTLVLFLSGMEVCLWRSNGWIAFFIFSCVFVVILGKRQRKIVFLLACVLLLTYILKHPVLNALNVTQPDTAEALSIPVQQVARVVADGEELSKEQYDLLSEIVDVDRIKDAYDANISDPMKSLIRQKGQQDYLREHKMDFVHLYVELGLKHPLKYLEAWVDQTKGYWNAGYEYWVWNGNWMNDLGIQGTIHSKGINELLETYLWLYQNVGAAQIFISIGFYTWVLGYLFYICILKKEKEKLVILSLPTAILISLLLAAPVYSEFRYAYAVIYAVPFLGAITFYKRA